MLNPVPNFNILSYRVAVFDLNSNSSYFPPWGFLLAMTTTSKHTRFSLLIAVLSDSLLIQLYVCGLSLPHSRTLSSQAATVTLDGLVPLQ
jgi:hypothetical protein